MKNKARNSWNDWWRRFRKEKMLKKYTGYTNRQAVQNAFTQQYLLRMSQYYEGNLTHHVQCTEYAYDECTPPSGRKEDAEQQRKYMKRYTKAFSMLYAQLAENVGDGSMTMAEINAAKREHFIAIWEMLEHITE